MAAAQMLSKLHGVVGEVGQTVVHEHRLQHHGRAAEDLDIDTDRCIAQQLQQEALGQGVVLRIGDGVQDAADKADDAADRRRDQREDQRVLAHR